jgi:hypothetical protein
MAMTDMTDNRGFSQTFYNFLLREDFRKKAVNLSYLSFSSVIIANVAVLYIWRTPKRLVWTGTEFNAQPRRPHAPGRGRLRAWPHKNPLLKVSSPA